MTLFDVFAKREADDTGLPKQASDAELLAWSQEIRRLPDPGEELLVLQPVAVTHRSLRRQLRAEPVPVGVAAPVAAPVPPANVAAPRRQLRARPLVAPPADRLDRTA